MTEAVNTTGLEVFVQENGIIRVKQDGKILGHTSVHIPYEELKKYAKDDDMGMLADTITELNMQRMYGKQLNLHEKIAEATGVDFNHYTVIDNLRCGFHVEVAELANEIEFFKHWKKDKNADSYKQLDELSDCLHVLLSICVVRDYQKVIRSVTELPLWQDMDYIDMFEMLRRNDLATSQDVAMALTVLVGIGRKLGFTITEIIEGYYDKNTVNVLRQSKGY